MMETFDRMKLKGKVDHQALNKLGVDSNSFVSPSPMKNNLTSMKAGGGRSDMKGSVSQKAFGNDYYID